MPATTKPDTPWDAAFLDQFEKDAREAREQAQFERDYELSAGVIVWESSNAAFGYRVCPRKLCRRDRTCRTDTLTCAVLPQAPPSLAEREAIDEVYADLQRERMEQAMAEEE